MTLKDGQSGDGALPAIHGQPPTGNIRVPHTSIHRIDADGVSVFYREAGPPSAPVVLLPHGFPASSFEYRELIPRLAGRYRVIAPDLPGFGFTEIPPNRHYQYSFDALAHTISAFTGALHLTRYALYVFGYGAPTGFRLAMARPERVTAIVSQNGNAYEEGLEDAWAPIRRYWSEPTSGNVSRRCHLIPGISNVNAPEEETPRLWWSRTIRRWLGRLTSEIGDPVTAA
jgi:pimeloyl-ACP methyl ester carboxylesterase